MRAMRYARSAGAKHPGRFVQARWCLAFSICWRLIRRNSRGEAPAIVAQRSIRSEAIVEPGTAGALEIVLGATAARPTRRMRIHDFDGGLSLSPVRSEWPNITEP